jgi:hypothetical protein
VPNHHCRSTSRLSVDQGAMHGTGYWVVALKEAAEALASRVQCKSGRK